MASLVTLKRLEEIKGFWLRVCGIHDYGVMEYGCNCVDSEMDVRPVIMELVTEVERLQKEADVEANLRLAD